MWLSILIYSLLVLSSLLFCLIFGLPYLLSLALPERLRGRVIRYIILVYGRMIVYVAMRPCIRVRFEDLSGGPRRPGIYVFNHRSSSDPFLVSVLGEEIVQIVNGWPMRLKFYGYFARLGEYIDSTAGDYASFAAQIRMLNERGVSIVAFPEGTRSGGRHMNAFRSGIFHIARELRLPIYPGCIAGNEEMPTRRFKFKKSGTIMVRLLPPIVPTEQDQFPSAYALKIAVHRRIRQETAKMDKELDDAVIQPGK
ncbi:MAG: lysophospholipid acyltransferase family protein [Lentisphaeria bacterium]|nr:lysophospholipid acyltransferase family protein [Lentisphaeria bacterium]